MMSYYGNTNPKTCRVSTKEQLKSAIERNEREIIVTGALANQLKPLAKLNSISAVKIGLMITALTSVAAVGGIVTFASGGLAAPAGMAALHLAVPAVAASAGVSAGAVTALIAVVGIIGLTAFALAKGYNVEMCVGDTIYLKAKK